MGAGNQDLPPLKAKLFLQFGTNRIAKIACDAFPGRAK